MVIARAGLQDWETIRYKRFLGKTFELRVSEDGCFLSRLSLDDEHGGGVQYKAAGQRISLFPAGTVATSCIVGLSIM